MAKTAGHVLTMCVRALDYCPPLDLTFGDYLRALITADLDLVPYDPLCYRVAFVEAFRRHGIYPMDLSTLSVGTLRWNPANDDGADLLKVFQPVLRELRKFATEVDYLETKKGRPPATDRREALFRHARQWRARLHAMIRREIRKVRDKDKRSALTVILGIDLTGGDEHFEVHSLQLSKKNGPFDRIETRVIFSLIQERTVETVEREGDKGVVFPFEGGCTIICDLERDRIDYVICKNILSRTRRERQVAFNRAEVATLAACYYGQSGLSGMAQRFAMLHADEGEDPHA